MIHELPQLNIFADQYSKRLFFGKTRETDSAWHILDYAASQVAAGKVYSTALHYEAIAPAVSADTVEQLQRIARDSDFICTDCLREFDNAKEIIMSRRLMKFDQHIIIEDSK